MSRRLVNLTLDTLADLPQPCRGCVFWELDPATAQRVCATGDPGLEKEAWLSETLLEWGSCGQLVYVDDILAGFVIYAPPHHLPGSYAFPTAPPSPDAVLLTTAYVRPDLAGGGLRRMLMQGAARDLARRGVHAIEAFGDARPGEPDWSVATGPLAERACVAPADYFRAVGFTTVSPPPALSPTAVGAADGGVLADRAGGGGEPMVDRVGVVAAASAGVAADRPRQRSAAARRARRVLTSMEPVGTSASIG